MNHNILITSVGRRVSLVRAFQKELLKFFPNNSVFTTDLNPKLSAACQVADKSFRITKVTSENYVHELLDICKKNKIGMIIPTIDTELLVLSRNKHLFSGHSIQVVVSQIEFIEKCRNKHQINDFFVENNIPIPKNINKKELTFPLFIKPYDGSLSIDTFIIKKHSELTSYHFSNKKLMFMEYVSPDEYDEYTIDMYYDRNNTLKCIVPRQRLEIRAGEINKGITRKNKLISYINERLFKIEGALGCITLQLFLSKESEKVIGIEVNPRFGGGYPLAYLAGANYPKWLIEEYFLGSNLQFFENWKENLLMLRYDSEILVQE